MNNASAVAGTAPSLMRRVAAMIYDALLVIAISIFYGAVMAGLNVAVKGAPATGERISWGIFGVGVFIGWLLIIVLFFCYFWHKSGQTLGMKTWRMKIVDSASSFHPTYSQCVIRLIGALFSLSCVGIGYMFMYTNAERQTLHDKISGTHTLLIPKT